jgi:hypothetical protein
MRGQPDPVFTYRILTTPRTTAIANHPAAKAASLKDFLFL